MRPAMSLGQHQLASPATSMRVVARRPAVLGALVVAAGGMMMATARNSEPSTRNIVVVTTQFSWRYAYSTAWPTAEAK